MKRAEIRKAVDVALAENGYARGWYAWRGPSLYVFDRETAEKWKPGKLADRFSRNKPVAHAEAVKVVRLPSGISRKRLVEQLSVLPSIGEPRPYLRIDVRGAKDDGGNQLGIEDAIRDAR